MSTAARQVWVFVFWGAGGLILLYALALLLLGLGLTSSMPVIERPLLAFTVLSAVAGLVFLALFVAAKRIAHAGAAILWPLFGLGFLMRLVLIPAEPIREDDHYRYMLDGAMVAQGMNPYALSPAEIGAKPDLKARLTGAAGAPGFAQVNHPELKTIYPPVVQSVFALAHWVAPWRAEGLRVVYLIMDCAAFLVLLRLLTAMAYPSAFAALYWWNPLILAQGYGHAHMEVSLFAPLFLAMLLHQQRRPGLAGGALGLAAGIKLWPALLLLPFLAGWRGGNGARLKLLSAFALTSLALLGPLAQAMMEPQSGAAAYAARWLFNNPMIAMVHGTVMGGGIALGLSADAAQTFVRIALAGLAAAAALLIARGVLKAWLSLHGALLALALCVFALAPAQYPWYALWLVPFLALVPSVAAASFVATVPVSYLLPLFEAAGTEHLYHWGLAWLPLLVFTGLWAWRGLDVR